MASDLLQAKLTCSALEAMGGKRYRGEVPTFTFGKPHCTLFVVEGYNDSGWWAMCVKYPIAKMLDHYASTHPHFDKRLKTVADLRRLAGAIGIELKEDGK